MFVHSGDSLEFGPQWLQIFVERLVDLEERTHELKLCDGTMMVFGAARRDLGGVERRVARPLKQVLVHVPVISAQDRIQLLVIEIEGIHQRHGVGPEPAQELLNVSGDLQGLWNTQQPGLQRTRGPEP